ncbi:hypothetical protein X975_24209, partial [Stegodyphus mimosarum]
MIKRPMVSMMLKDKRLCYLSKDSLKPKRRKRGVMTIIVAIQRHLLMVMRPNAVQW